MRQRRGLCGIPPHCSISKNPMLRVTLRDIAFYKDFSDGWLPGPYFNIYPSIAVFESQASISRLHREGRKMLRDFYIVSENSTVYTIDQELIYRCAHLFDKPGFADL